MSAYCDACDETMKDTTAYVINGQTFNYCYKCVEVNGYEGEGND